MTGPLGPEPPPPTNGRRPSRSEEEWAEIYQEDLRTSLASERQLVWMELIALGAVAVLIILHFTWT